MDTYFASPKKAGIDELAVEIKAVSQNPLVSGLLHSISGLLAIIDEHRQIVALNDSFLKMLGIDNPEQALGLRPGEALQCKHAYDEPAGCGTTELCSTCGAAIAIVSSFEQDIPNERICALSAKRGGKEVDIVLVVRAQPIKIENKKFILLFLQDITIAEQRAALERTFYHDVSNMLNMLMQASELLIEDYPSELSETIHHSSLRLVKEMAIQRCLSESEVSSYLPIWGAFTTKKVFNELQLFFAHHPAANGKKIEFSNEYPLLSIKSDLCLLLRVLCNMIINALEATEEKGTVSVWLEDKKDGLDFCVKNAQQIPREIALRIFQRNFSTKAQAGRGIGTFSMKLFGEKVLGGKVSFSSSKEDGTIFKFTHFL